MIRKSFREVMKTGEANAALLEFVGMDVVYTDDNGKHLERVLTAKPWQLGHGQWVCKIDGHSGGVCCSRIRPKE